MIRILIYFCFYSILGWCVDTAYRSWDAGRFKRGGFSKFPFSPIYGIAGLFIITWAPLISHWHILVEWAFFTLTCSAGEYIGGVVTLHFYKRRLWDYSKDKYDLNGHTGPGYAAAWGTLALIIIYVIQPQLERLVDAFL